MGFFAEAGPVQIFVSNHVSTKFMFFYTINSSYSKWYSICSPFVCAQLIPDDMEFQSGDVPCYATSDGLVYHKSPRIFGNIRVGSSLSSLMFTVISKQVRIQKDSEVRLKIVGTRVDVTEIVSFPFCCIFTILLRCNYSSKKHAIME